MAPGECDEKNQYPSGLSLALILTSCFICTFLTSLDRMIISTAIPRVTGDFKSVTDIAWYGSAYLLAQCASQLLYGKIYTFFGIKGTFLTSILLFEIGSAVCGAAPNFVAFIIGRAIAGLGASGILGGVLVIFVHALPLHKRPLYQGMFDAVFGVSSVTGPLLRGVFTSKVSWRWCFYINLPLGSVAAVVIYFILKIPNKEATQLDLKAKLKQLDFYSTGFLMPGLVCMIQDLEWGVALLNGTWWSDRKIIVLLVLSGLLFIGFVLVRYFLPGTATIPPRIFKQRSILAGFFSVICVGSQLTIFDDTSSQRFPYYVPIWFQAIQGVSAVESGIHFLLLVLSMVVSILSSGVLIRHMGYYTPVMTLGVSSLMYFGNYMSSAIFLSVAQNTFNNQLLRRLSSIPGVNPGKVLDSGVTSLTDLPESVRVAVLVAYNEAIRHIFLLALVLVCLGMLGASSLGWRSTKKDVDKTKTGD
ncbi:major facilitator superfamily domain-containing protein [Colletotrichum cereale]|nr:major facilitator superfamily domain-containing protein [Colletotrichum cereale]